jgi:hypothetical protein
MRADLKSIQASFVALLSAREQSAAPPIFSTKPDLLDERIAIYRANLQAVWANTLRNAYPVIDQLVGADFFAQLSILYSEQFPSQSGDLHEFGEHFSDFLRDEKSVENFPYFADVAALEWKIHRSYYAADAEAISLNEFLTKAGESASESSLQFHPAASLFRADVAAVQIYLAHQQTEVQPLDVDLQTSSFALVSRDVWRHQVTELDQAEFTALHALHQGYSLSDALDVAMNIDGDFSVPNVLQRWFALSIFTGFICKDAP